jgi:hypothetical protein
VRFAGQMVLGSESVVLSSVQSCVCRCSKCTPECSEGRLCKEKKVEENRKSGYEYER